MIHCYGVSTGSLYDKFENEYLILTQSISHDNIIKIFTYFIDQPTEEMINLLPKETSNLLKETDFENKKERIRSSLAIVMEYIPKNLKNSNYLKLPITQLLSICKGIGEGINHLFKEKIVHRDLKLEDILIDEEGYIPVICNFGMAAKLDDNFTLRMSDSVKPGGNTSHLAPEILNSFQKQKKRERNRDRLFKATGF